MDFSYDAILLDIIVDDGVVMLMHIKLCYTHPFEAFHQHILSVHMVLIHHGLFQHEYIYSFHIDNNSTQCDLYPACFQLSIAHGSSDAIQHTLH